MNSLGVKRRDLRKSEGKLLRQVAAYLEIERGERRLTREQVIKFANYENVKDEELLTLWLVTKFRTQLTAIHSQCKD